MLKNRRGTTLVEIMLAMAIIAIAAVSSLEFYHYCQKSFIVSSKLKLAAADFARETAEEIYMLDHGNSILGDGAAIQKDLPSTGDFCFPGTRTYTVTQVPDTDYKVVEVKVLWNT